MSTQDRVKSQELRVKEKAKLTTRKTLATGHSWGFTLIELMVVIAIITVLAAVGIVTYTTAQKASRNSKKLQDLKAVQSALQLYKVDNGTYPVTPENGSIPNSRCSSIGLSATNFISDLVPAYMPAFPDNPSTNGVDKACYVYSASARDYKFYIYKDPELTDEEILREPNYIDPWRTGACGEVSLDNSWAVFTPNAKCGILPIGDCYSINCDEPPSGCVFENQILNSCDGTPTCGDVVCNNP